MHARDIRVGMAYVCTILPMGWWGKARDLVLGFDADPVDSAQMAQLTMMRLWAAASSDRPVERELALSVPAVARQHRLVATSLATLPLREIDENDRPVPNEFLRQFDRDVANVVTMAQTLADLIYDGVSWWWKTETDAFGYPVSIRRLAPGSVTMTPRRRGRERTPAPLPAGTDPRDVDVYVEGELVTQPELHLIRFDSPEPPLLVHGARTLRRAMLLDTLAETYANNPRPLDFLSPAENAEDLDPEEALQLLEVWMEARRTRGTAWLNKAVKYNSVDQPTPADLQLVPLQARVNVDLANLLGISPEEVGENTTSRVYQNATDRRRDRINDLLAGYMAAVAQRLSMRDVTAPGRRVEFDLDDYLRADPATRGEYYESLWRMGAIESDEVRDRERLGPRPAGAARRHLAAVPDPAPGRTAAGRTAAGFADDAAGEHFEFFDRAAVDVQRRTIAGRVVPYGEVAIKAGRRFEFMPGSLTYAERSRNKMLRDHDQSQAFGVLVSDEERPDGRYAVYRVAPGAAGDEMLALAASGVYDGLSPGVVFDLERDTERVGGVHRVRRAQWRETSLVAIPAFDGARVTSVTATSDQGETMPCQNCGQIHADGVACPTTSTAPPAAPPAAVEPLTAPVAASFTADQVAAMFAAAGLTPPAAPPAAQPVSPTRPAPGPAAVSEPLPYRLELTRDPSAQTGMRFVFGEGPNGYDFSTDVGTMIFGDPGAADAEQRVGALIRAQFDVDRADTSALSPNVNRPDLWVPQLDFATPLWDMINSGSTDGRTFDVPKWASAANLVGPATEGVEPTPGSSTVTSQTVTPSQVWGKVEVTRQAMRRATSPALSGILWENMLREYYEEREAAVATFLNTLTAAADIALPGTGATPTNAERKATAEALEAAMLDLQFARGGNRFRAFAVHQALYRVLGAVRDDAGRPMYPMINPMNANGTTNTLFTTMNVGGTTAVPAWALGTPANASTNSWLFDPTRTRGWASAPERLEWNFGATIQQVSGTTGNAPQLSHVTIGIYGDVAFANLDINGVRQVTFDPNTAA